VARTGTRIHGWGFSCCRPLTATIGLSPAALGLGAGSDTNGPLAVAVIGGLINSTLLTLVVIPSVYSLVEHRISRFHKNVIQ
jgi:HAE1 family hydrophobic/amphiphilic exporter-1